MVTDHALGDLFIENISIEEAETGAETRIRLIFSSSDRISYIFSRIFFAADLGKITAQTRFNSSFLINSSARKISETE